MRHGTHILWLAILASASTAHAQTSLRYQFKEGDTLRYVFEQQITTTESLKGKETETTLNVIWDLSWNVLKVDRGGTAQLQITIDRARMLMQRPNVKAAADSADKAEPEDDVRKIMARSVKLAASMDLRGTLLPTGEIKDVKIPAAALKAIKQFGGAGKEEDVLNSEMVKAMLFSQILPAESIAKGKTWSSKVQAKIPLYKTNLENTYTYVGPTEVDGVTLQKITIKPAMKVEQGPNAQIKVDLKDFKGTGHTLFDNKMGRLIESVTNQLSVMDFETMGMTLTQTVEQRVTIRLRKK